MREIGTDRLTPNETGCLWVLGMIIFVVIGVVAMRGC